MADVTPIKGTLRSEATLRALQVRKRRKKFPPREVYEVTFQMNDSEVVVEEGQDVVLHLTWNIEAVPGSGGG